jgi:hypothetical protein
MSKSERLMAWGLVLLTFSAGLLSMVCPMAFMEFLLLSRFLPTGT